MLNTTMVRTFLILFVVTGSSGFRNYQSEIPNGAIVTHPCDPSQIWAGVGHLVYVGGGANNQFGKDFRNDNHKWTKSLCEADSDGDGKTNGFELGDPNCVWIKGQVPLWKNVTHPGVCDPVDSPLCKAKNESACSNAANYVCDAVTNTPDVKSVDIRLDYTKVPVQETTYICQTMELPSDQTYDVIGYQPLINNTDVNHHMILWGCRNSDAGEAYRKPAPCGMAPTGCRALLVLWTQGYIGKCYPPENGLRIGRNAWTYGVMQLHWNNPMNVDSYFDNSGFKLHYTPTLRKNVEATLVVGVKNFEIPPGKSLHVESGSRMSKCSLLVHTVYLHMHLVGTKAYLKQKRGGKELRTLANDYPYEYNEPVFHQMYPPVELSLGDELEMTCEYNSSSKSTVTKWGDATSDEMCFAFITVTPAVLTSSPNYIAPCVPGETGGAPPVSVFILLLSMCLCISLF